MEVLDEYKDITGFSRVSREGIWRCGWVILQVDISKIGTSTAVSISAYALSMIDHPL
jgi:hypothetical protein